MNVSLMTIISINLSLSVFLMILLPLLNWNFCLKNLEGRCLTACCVVIMIRALIPVEFPFSRTIPNRHIIPAVRHIMIYPVNMGIFSVKVFEILLFLWTGGAILLILWKLWLYFKLQKIIRKLPVCRDEIVLEVWQSLLAKYPSVRSVKIVMTDQNISPMIAGFRNPLIVLPKYSFTRAEYQLILEHEILHWTRHDTYVKFAADIMCSVYWWNPLFYFLRSKIFELIELGNDRQLTSSFSFDEKVAYMRCLTNTAHKICHCPTPFALSFDSHEGKVLRRRIHVIGDFRTIGRIKESLIFGTLTLFLWLSTSFTLEPFATPAGGPYHILDESNCYIIQNGDLYDLYFQDELYFTVDSTEYFDPDIPLY